MAKKRTVVLGLDDLAAKLKTLEAAVSGEAMERALLVGAVIVEADAKRRAPVRTGDLRDNIRSEVTSEGNTAQVAVGVDKDVFYASFIEFGTAHHAAQPFLRPAIDENEDAVRKAVTEALRKEVERAVR